MADTLEEQDVIVGEGSWSLKNTVVSSSDEVLRFDPDDPAFSECEISWTTEHLPTYVESMKVPIFIRDLAGNIVYSYTVQDVPLGASSWVWGGAIFQQEPDGPTVAQKGIYTYNVGDPVWNNFAHVNCVSTDQPCCGRGDSDKSEWLTVDVKNFYWFEKDPENGTLKGVVRYELSRAAAEGSVNIKFFDYQLNPVGEVAGASEASDKVHFSDVYEITVPYDQDGNLIQPVYCVAFATETEADGNLNRDRQPKPALQKGTTQLEDGRGDTTPSGAVLISAKHGGGYPQPEQTEDGNIEVTMSFPLGFAGETIHIGVFDPPDMSPYVSDPADWDNIWTDPQRWVQNNAGTTVSTRPRRSRKRGGKAIVEAVLTITDQMAGDSYVVVGSPFEPPTLQMAMDQFNGGNGHLLVAWKQVYIEVDSMYHSGTDLAADVNAGATQIEVDDAQGFSANDSIKVFDAGPAPGETRSEDAQIAGINGNIVTLTAPLQNDYRAGYPAAAVVFDADYRGAAIVKANEEVYSPIIQPGLKQSLGDIAECNDADGGAFVHAVAPEAGVGSTPYRPLLTGAARWSYRNTWFLHAHPTKPEEGQHNYMWVLGCDTVSERWSAEPVWGLSIRSLHAKWVSVGRIASQAVVGDVTAHEIGHQWLTGPTVDSGHGPDLSHCGQDGCLIGYARDRANGIMEYCVDHLQTIRRFQDPVGPSSDIGE